MGGSVNFPVGRDGFSVTVSVADQLAALALPVVAPLAVALAGLAGLPDLVAPDVVVEDCFSSRLEGVRAVMDDCVDALGALHAHQNRCAALLVVLVERLQAVAVAEAGVLSLDAWQQETSLMGVRAEIAGLLHVNESVAGKLMHHATALVHHLPTTLGVLAGGGLGWEQAVVIAGETTLLREAGHSQGVIDAFELVLLGKADGCTGSSFREKARRARERAYPDSMVAKTRRAFTDRHLRVNQGQDGMSWLSLFAPSPTIEAIFTQCTTTSHATQGPHEPRTLSQLRADIAAALLLGQTMDENHIHTPPAPAEPAPAPAQPEPELAPAQPEPEPASAVGTEAMATAAQRTGPSDHAGGFNRTRHGTPFRPPEPGPGPGPEACEGSESWGFLEIQGGGAGAVGGVVPVFDDPNYTDPGFIEPGPEPWDEQTPGGYDGARPPNLTPAPGNTPSGDAGGEVWPPLPQVTPVVLIPALSLLGCSSDPAWMEGVGPISIEVAKRLTAQASSFYRVLVDPMTNKPLDSAPDTYRITKAMKVMLSVRDEFCQFPGCTTAAVNCEVDHVQRFEIGGRSVYNNLQTLCRRHHLLKHFKDDKTRQGCVRTDQSPERQQIRLRGWTPSMTASGHPGWTSPTGRYYPPAPMDTQPPSYPQWLKNHLQTQNDTGNPDNIDDPDDDHDDHDEYGADGDGWLTDTDYHPADLPPEATPPTWTPATVPQPPPGMFVGH